MKTTGRDETVETRGSRFDYFGDEPTEGGVTSVASEPASPNARGRRDAVMARAHGAGVPGPDERLLDISELTRTVGMHYTHHFAFPAGALPEVETVAPTTGTLTLTNAGAALLLTGKVKATLGLECGRCLNPTEEPIETAIEEHFDLVTRNNAFNQEEVQAVDEDSPAAVISANILNVADLLRQNLLLASPLQPLCREDCPGIVLPGVTVTLASDPHFYPDPEEEAPTPGGDNPLKHLAELLEARRGEKSSAE